MNSLISTRRPLRTALAAAALTAALGGLVAGCGGDDSTATGNPTQAPTATSGSAQPSKTGDSESSSTQAPVTEPGEAATAPPEQPQPVPSGFPGPAAAPAPADARSKALIDELNKEGVQSSGNGENAVAIANFVCASVRDGSPQEQIDTTVTAMAGVELNLAGSNMKPEDAAKIYRDAAQKTYCK